MGKKKAKTSQNDKNIPNENFFSFGISTTKENEMIIKLYKKNYEIILTEYKKTRDIINKHKDLIKEINKIIQDFNLTLFQNLCNYYKQLNELKIKLEAKNYSFKNRLKYDQNSELKNDGEKEELKEALQFYTDDKEYKNILSKNIEANKYFELIYESSNLKELKNMILNYKQKDNIEEEITKVNESTQNEKTTSEINEDEHIENFFPIDNNNCLINSSVESNNIIKGRNDKLINNNNENNINYRNDLFGSSNNFNLNNNLMSFLQNYSPFQNENLLNSYINYNGSNLNNNKNIGGSNSKNNSNIPNYNYNINNFYNNINNNGYDNNNKRQEKINVEINQLSDNKTNLPKFIKFANNSPNNESKFLNNKNALKYLKDTDSEKYIGNNSDKKQNFNIKGRKK